MRPETRIATLVINDDSTGRRDTARMLRAAGCDVREASDAEIGLTLLRDMPAPTTVLFHVTLFGNMMAGLDCAGVLGAVARDARLAERHHFILVTPSPENVEAVLGLLLRRLSVRILAEPVDRAELLAALDGAAEAMRVPA
jgi:CheY-like chemotaxis protein